jgi:hypothetical protein
MHEEVSLSLLLINAILTDSTADASLTETSQAVSSRPESQCLGQASRLLFRPGVRGTCERISGRRTGWTSAAMDALLWASAG